MDELQSVTGTSAYGYTYDGVGNRTNSGFGAANSLNQYANFTYDLRGDLTDDGVFTYAWDADGHMTVATAKDNSVQEKNQYDGQGRRVEKDVYTWSTSLNGGNGGWALSYSRQFDYAGGQLVAELDGNGSLITTYAWAGGTLLSVTDWTPFVPKTYMAIADASGNTAALADPATGAVAAAYTYDPYGKLLSSTGPAAGVCNILFGQGYTDRETGLILLGARYYSPVQGRFISRDPIAEQGGSNLYQYANNDPLNLSDPGGTAPGAISRAWTNLKYVYTHPMTVAGTELNVGLSVLKGDPHGMDRNINSYREATARNYSASDGNEYVLAYKSLQQGQANVVNGLQDVGVSILNTPASIDNAIYRLAGSNKRDVLIVSSDWSKGMYINEGTDAHNLSKFLGGNGAFIVITAGGGSLVSGTSTVGRTLNVANQGLTIANGTASGLNAVSDFREGNIKSGSANTGVAVVNLGMAILGMRGRATATENISPMKIRFTQPTASPNFSTGGHTIQSTMEELMAGKSVSSLPTIRVVEFQGELFSLDNRRLVTFQAAGVPEIPVQRLSLNDVNVSNEFFKKFNPIEGGTKIVITPSDDRAAAIALLRKMGKIE